MAAPRFSGMLTSKVTRRSQTTLPSGVRQALSLQTGEQVGYVINGNRVEMVNASAQEHTDPAIQAFLAFLGRDLQTHPEHVHPFPHALLARARELTQSVVIDHDAPIEGAIAI